MARNTNRQGANFELDVMHYLDGCECEFTHAVPQHIGWRGFGYDSTRSSGSKGKIDIFSIGPLQSYEGGESSDAKLLVIQCKIKAPVKATPLPPAERMNLMDLALRANAEPMTASKAKDAVTGKIRPHFRRLTGPGPYDWVAWNPGEDY